VSFARISWLIIVAICAVGAGLLILGGYTGYAITAGAVGLAAAVNLLPPPGSRAELEDEDPATAALGHRAPPGAGPPARPAAEASPEPAPGEQGPHQPAR
jgi:hypothetical protein